MAAKLQGRGLVSFGKCLVGQIHSRHPIASPPLSLRRVVHVSVYDKDPDKHVFPTVVPDDVIQPLPEMYWAPHPETDVFSPTSNHNPSPSGENTNDGPNFSLEQKAFFCTLENLDKSVQP